MNQTSFMRGLLCHHIFNLSRIVFWLHLHPSLQVCFKHESVSWRSCPSICRIWRRSDSWGNNLNCEVERKASFHQTQVSKTNVLDRTDDMLYFEPYYGRSISTNEFQSHLPSRLIQFEYQNTRWDCERTRCWHVSIEGPPIRQRQSSGSQMVIRHARLTLSRMATASASLLSSPHNEIFRFFSDTLWLSLYPSG